MKQLNKIKISAVIALMLAGTILASAANLPTYHHPNSGEEKALDYGEDYLENLNDLVDQYMEEAIVEFQEIGFIKVYDANQELIVEGEKGKLEAHQLRLLRQADLLSELNGTAYYQINN